jgi:hypothetical protein
VSVCITEPKRQERKVPSATSQVIAATPLLAQLRFTRLEWERSLAGLSEADGEVRVGRMNCVSWMVAHLGWQEQHYWLTRMSGSTPRPELNSIGAQGSPASTPSLGAMRAAWQDVTSRADVVLDRLDEAALRAPLSGGTPRIVGNAMQRVIYHYWFHVGEILAIRQLLDHPDLPEFVGDIDHIAPYGASDSDPRTTRASTAMASATRASSSA